MTSTSQAPPVSHADLDSVVSAPRFSTFLHAAAGDTELARNLYVWNRDLSVAFLADIAILEVALRNAMNVAAEKEWGPHWYASEDIRLDDRSSGQLNRAWNYLPKATQRRSSDPDVPGRLIAHCMFGFWTNLLDSGDHIGRSPRKLRANYEDLWKVFKNAFPGGRLEAKSQRDALRKKPMLSNTASAQKHRAQELRETVFTRSWVHGICKNVNDLRNRVAHHEPLITGFPLNGKSQRMSAEEAHEQCRLLARIIDRRLAGWLDANSTVPTLLAARPS